MRELVRMRQLCLATSLARCTVRRILLSVDTNHETIHDCNHYVARRFFRRFVTCTPRRNRPSRRTVPGARRSPRTCSCKAPCDSATSPSTATRCIGSKPGPRSKAATSIVRRTPDGKIDDVLPPPFSARTTVHEYGGGALAAADGTVYFTNYADQRLWRLKPGEAPQPITAESKLRFADFVHDAPRNRLIAVCEDHTQSDHEPANRIVAVESGRRQSHARSSKAPISIPTRASAPTARQLCLALVESSEHAVGRHRAVRRADRRRRLARQAAQSRRRRRRIDLPTELVARRHALFRLRPHQLVESLRRARRQDRADPADGRRVRRAAMGLRHDDLRLPARRHDHRPLHAAAEHGTSRGSIRDPGKHEPIKLPYSNISSIDVAGNRAYAIAGSPTEPESLVEIDLDDRQVASDPPQLADRAGSALTHRSPKRSSFPPTAAKRPTRFTIRPPIATSAARRAKRRRCWSSSTAARPPPPPPNSG